MTAKRRTPVEMAQDHYDKAVLKHKRLVDRRVSAMQEVTRLDAEITRAERLVSHALEHPLLNPTSETVTGSSAPKSGTPVDEKDEAWRHGIPLWPSPEDGGQA